MSSHLLEVGWLNVVCEVCHDAWGVVDFRKDVHLQVWGEWVWQTHVTGKRAQDQIPHLDAVWRDDVTERVVVVAEEFREVVKQH